MRDAFLANQVRGIDASGLLTVTHKEKAPSEIAVYKRAVSGSDFIQSSWAEKQLTETRNACLSVGHVRARTIGTNSDGNAHPFRIKRDDGSTVVGVHNGTLRGAWRNHRLAKGVEVDSEWAIKLIAEEGAAAFRCFDGAFAFVWFDSKHPDKVYMARNDERPLHFILPEGNQVILGASEAGMLGWLAERNKFKMNKEKGKESMFYLRPGLIYTFDTKEVRLDSNQPTFPKYDYTALPWSNYTPGGNSGYMAGSNRGDAGWAGNALDDDGIPWGYPTTGSRHFRSRYSNPDWDSSEKVLGNVKAAIRRARDKRLNPKADTSEDMMVKVLDGTIVGELEIQETLDRAIQKNLSNTIGPFRSRLKPNDMLLRFPQFVQDPITSGATKKEIKNVKSREEFGKVVEFTPGYYDTATSVLLGDVVVKDSDGTVVPLSGEIRGADAIKMKGISDAAILVTLVGHGYVRGGTTMPYYVVSRMKPDIYEDVRKRINESYKRNVSSDLH